MCQSKHAYTEEITEMLEDMLQVEEDIDKLTELPTITMKDIKHQIIIDKIRLRKQNINNIYKNELDHHKNLWENHLAVYISAVLPCLA